MLKFPHINKNWNNVQINRRLINSVELIAIA